MEQTLTTAAFISAALFIVWILLVDPAADDVHAGMDMTFLGALLMVPVIIFLLVGIALLFPVIIAIALIGLILYGLFMLLRWFMIREKTEQSSDPPKEGRVLASLRRIEKGVKALGKSRPITASRERVKDSTIKVRAALKSGSHKARDTYRESAQKVRETPKKFKERVVRVKEGAVKKAAQVREKMDRTIAAGKERSRMLRQQGGKNATDASKPQTHRRSTDGSGDTASRKNGADPRSTSVHRDAVAQKKQSDTSDRLREKFSPSTAGESSTPTSSNSVHKKDTHDRQHSEESSLHRHRDTKHSDGSRAGDSQSVSDEKVSRDGDTTLTQQRSTRDSYERSNGSDIRRSDHSRKIGIDQTNPRSSSGDNDSRGTHGKQAIDDRNTGETYMRSNDSSIRRSGQSHEAISDEKKDVNIRTEGNASASRDDDSTTQSSASRSSSREQAHGRDVHRSDTSAYHSSDDQKRSKDLQSQEEDSHVSRDTDNQFHSSRSKDASRNVSKEGNVSRADENSKQSMRDTAQSTLSDSARSFESVEKTSKQDAAVQERSSQREDGENLRASERRKSKEHGSEHHGNSAGKDTDRKRTSRKSLRERFTRLGRSVRSSDASGRNQSAKAKVQSGTSAEAKSAYHRFLEWAKNSVRKLDGSATKKHSSVSKVSTIRSIRRVHVRTDDDLFSEDYLKTMRPIGWKTRRKMNETYKKDAK